MEEKCARLNAMWHDFFEDPATRAAYRERGIEIADEVHTETLDEDEDYDRSRHIVRVVLIDARSDGVMTRNQANVIHRDICDELLSEIWDIRDELDVMQSPYAERTEDALRPRFTTGEPGEVLSPKFTLAVMLYGRAELLPDDD